MARIVFGIIIMLIGNVVVAQGLPKKFMLIKPGTSENDVVKLVGEPIKIERFVTVKNNTSDTSRYWRYQGDITVVFTNHAVSMVEPKWDNVLKHIQLYANRQDQEGIKIITGE